MHLSIAYMTCRQNPLIELFFTSLHRETGGDYTDTKLIIVDLYADQPGRRDQFSKLAPCQLTHVSPMPSVWQGPHRLTKRDYFAASTARNTALCLAPDGWIAYVDDLSYLQPGWLLRVRQAMHDRVIALGAYMKVKNLRLNSDGTAAYDIFPPGMDSRLRHIKSTDTPVLAGGSWLFGCSCCIPVEALLHINGWDTDCDSLGGEDYVCGIMLERAGYTFRYDPGMMTLESEEAHHDGSSLPRFDKGKSPNDKSHAMLNMVLGGRNRAPNYFGPAGIAGVRERVLAGESFPVIRVPDRDWYDGQPLSEL